AAPQKDNGDPNATELRGLLDEAVHRLPAKYQAAIVLCYLEGKSNEAAAQLLGCPLGTLQARLSRGRDMLRSNLARRGVLLARATLAGLLAQELASAAVPTSLVRTTVTAGAGNPAPAVLTMPATLADATLKGMAPSRWRIAAVALLSLALIGG